MNRSLVERASPSYVSQWAIRTAPNKSVIVRFCFTTMFPTVVPAVRWNDIASAAQGEPEGPRLLPPPPTDGLFNPSTFLGSVTFGSAIFSLRQRAVTRSASALVSDAA